MLFIAEKPDVAKAIAKAIGTNFSTKDGYMTDGKDTITWCFGHMMMFKDPEDYDEKYKFWKLEDLPFVFLPYQRKNNPKTSKQLKVIKDLVKQADTIVNAGDPDDEGQLLVDEILREVNNKKPVKRILINDNNTKVVQKSLANLEDNSKYEYMGYRAEARAVADQLFGYNLTRSYTIHHRAKTGEKATISIGRVQSAILGLVVRRDREHANHKKAFYYNVFGDFVIDSTVFSAKFIPTEKQSTDDKNRLIDEKQANEIAQFCKDKQATIVSAETTEKTTPPPLPYNLIKLQQDCSKKFGLNPSKTLEITQSLREKHQLITYNRSDCQYLSDEQHLDAASVLQCISANLTNLTNAVQSSDAKMKGRVFDSSKVSAHHAIIPSENVVDFSKLTKDEKNVYELIAVSYIAQFYPDYRYLQTKVIVDVDGYQFAITSNIPTVQGWKVLFSGELDENQDEEVSTLDLRQLGQGDLGICSDAIVKKEATKPLPLYTMATLLADLTRVAKYIKDPQLAKTLRERDKDKEGENGGIGTPATRNSIIDTLFQRGFMVEDKKKIISTDIGQKLYDQLSDRIRFPDLTAIWTEHFDSIQNQADVLKFIDFLMNEHIAPEVAQIKKSFQEITPVQADSPKFPCPKCGRDMALRKKGNNSFWACTGYFDTENKCSHIMSDNNGTPVEKQEPVQPESSYPCPKCNRPMALRDGKYGKYWGCTGFFDKENQCKNIMNDVDGKPVEKVTKTQDTVVTTTQDTAKVFLKASFADKDKVKALGAKWDKDNKSWYIPSGEDQAKFKQWL